MFNLSSYLEKFKNIKNLKDEKEIIKKILLEETNIFLTDKEVVFLKEEIKINGSSVQKNIIFLKKDILLQKIKEYLPNTPIKNIS